MVKLGERGALCADGSVRRRVSLRPMTPADTTGAGDCFDAGLIAGLLDGLDLPQAAALGCAAGALSTAAPGGTASAPSRAAALGCAAGALSTAAPGGTASAPDRTAAIKLASTASITPA